MASSSSSPPRAAVFVLTQNTPARRVHLQNTLYFLMKHWLAGHKHKGYAVVLFHEGDFDARAQREVLLGVRDECRHLVSFRQLAPDEFVPPSNVDAAKLADVVSLRVTPYWRNIKYRCMCRWWLRGWLRHAQGYDYVMRLDDDAYLEEPIEADLFEAMRTHRAVYASNMVHTDCGLCCYGMKAFFEARFPGKVDQIAKMFKSAAFPSRAVQLHPFRELLSLLGKPWTPSETIVVDQPTMYYNNFCVLDVAFWRSAPVAELFDAIDADGSIFYVRWGDAPLQSLAATLLAPRPDAVLRFGFAYSKRMQREAFIDDVLSEAHAYLPPRYDMTSCSIADADKGTMNTHNS